jgi:hypothetical protein
MLKLFRFLFVFILVSSFASTNGYSQHTLAYNLEVGNIFKVDQHAEQTIKMTMEGAEHTMKNTLEGIYIMEVIEVSVDSFILNSHFETFKFKTESDLYGILNNIDTTIPSEEDNMEAKIFEGLLNIDFQITLLKTGKIASVSGADALLNNMLEIAGIEDAFTRELVKKSAGSQFSNESLTTSIEQMTYMFPVTDVYIDSSWENTFTGAVEAENTWTLKEYNTDFTNIEGISNLRMNTDDSDATMNLKGTQQTYATIESNNGFFQEISITQEASGSTTLKAMNGVEIPTSLNSTITYKRIQ